MRHDSISDLPRSGAVGPLGVAAGVLAILRLAIRRLFVARARFGSLTIDGLTVRCLRAADRR